MASRNDSLLISEVAERTHVSESTLRMWERRYGFPTAARLPAGHRRYSERDIDEIQAVVGYRAQGLNLQHAIARVLADRRRDPISVAGHLRAGGATLDQLRWDWPLLALITAVVDEVALRAEPAVVAWAPGSGASADDVAPRLQELAVTSRLVVLLGRDGAAPEGSPVVEVPEPPPGGLGCERMVAVDGSGCRCAIAVRPSPGTADGNGGVTEWDVLWTLDAPLVRSAVQRCLDLARPHAPDLVGGVLAELAVEPTRQVSPEFVGALGTRLLRYLGRQPAPQSAPVASS